MSVACSFEGAVSYHMLSQAIGAKTLRWDDFSF